MAWPPSATELTSDRASDATIPMQPPLDNMLLILISIGWYQQQQRRVDIQTDNSLCVYANNSITSTQLITQHFRRNQQQDEQLATTKKDDTMQECKRAARFRFLLLLLLFLFFQSINHSCVYIVLSIIVVVLLV